MDLTAQFLRDSLHRVDLEGWDSAAGRQLLDYVRRTVVVPVVRRSGLRGPAADQAEASGWEAAWDALRRPTARTAENPGGMVWAAVRRAVAAEIESARLLGRGAVIAMAPGAAAPGVDATGIRAPGAEESATDHRAGHVAQLHAPARRTRCLSLDELTDGGWQPTQGATRDEPDHGPVVSAVLDALVDVGWNRAEAADAIEIMADHAARGRTGSPTTRWRWVSLRVGVPEWQARRLAGLLLGGGEWPGVLELASRCGLSVLGDPAVQAALRSTTVRWAAGPGAWLEGFERHKSDRGIA